MAEDDASSDPPPPPPPPVTKEELDWYKRLHEGWLRGNARGAKPGQVPVAVPPAVFDRVEMHLWGQGDSHDWGRIYIIMYVMREN